MSKPLYHNMDELCVFGTLRSPQQFHFKQKNIIDLL